MVYEAIVFNLGMFGCKRWLKN